jgi:hypothetical protein
MCYLGKGRCPKMISDDTELAGNFNIGTGNNNKPTSGIIRE